MRYVSLYCKCGAAWKAIVNEYAVPSIEAEWKKLHSGEGCAPVDAKTAARGRARRESAK